MDDELCFFRLAGVSFYQGALEQCCPGEPVRFFHEPDNPHDELAIRVEALADGTIGYVPKASPLHKLIHERGRGVAGTIFSIGKSRACLIGATVSIAITDDDIATTSYFPGQVPPEPPKGGFRYWVDLKSRASVEPSAGSTQ